MKVLETRQKSICCNIEDLNIFPIEYISRLAAENSMLRLIVNTLMNRDEVPDSLKNEIINRIGVEWFHDGAEFYVWKGIR